MSLKHDLQLAPRSSPCGRRSCGTGPQLSDLVGHSPKRMSDWKSTQTVIVTGDIGKKMVRSTVTMLYTFEKFQVDCVHPSDLGCKRATPLTAFVWKHPRTTKDNLVFCASAGCEKKTPESWKVNLWKTRGG